jgi:small redox-active disulfide protein 2
VHIRVLGSGCANCKALERVARQAADDLRISVEVEKVEDYGTIAGYGVMRTPALVVDDELVLAGRVPTLHEMRLLLEAQLRVQPASRADLDT